MFAQMFRAGKKNENGTKLAIWAIAGLLTISGVASSNLVFAAAKEHSKKTESKASKTTKPLTATKPADAGEKTTKANTDADVESGPKVTTQQHGDWLVECYEPALNGVNCQIKQRIVESKTDQNILVMSLAFDPKENTNVIQYVLPLDFLLTPGVSIEVGDYNSVAGVNRCNTKGCFIEGTTDKAFINQMNKSPKDGRVVIVSRTGQKIGINFSTKGFSQAYSQMVKENKRLSKLDHS